MSGWVPMDASTWPLIMEQLPRPVSPEVAEMDLRWLADRDGRLPSQPELAERWGWHTASGRFAEKRIRRLISAERWVDPMQRKGGRRADKGRTEGGRTTRQPTQPPSEGRTEGGQGADGGLRARTSAPSPSPSPSYPPNPPSRGGLSDREVEVLVDEVTLDAVVAALDGQDDEVWRRAAEGDARLVAAVHEHLASLPSKRRAGTHLSQPPYRGSRRRRDIAAAVVEAARRRAPGLRLVQQAGAAAWDEMTALWASYGDGPRLSGPVLGAWPLARDGPAEEQRRRAALAAVGAATPRDAERERWVQAYNGGHDG